MPSFDRMTALGGLLLLTAARPICAQPWFRGIGVLDGGTVSTARDLSADSLVVSGDSGLFAGEAVRWSLEEGLLSITLGANGDTNGGISGLGKVIAGGFYGDGTRHAFRWTAETGAESIGDLDGGRFRSIATGVSARGDIIVGVGGSDNSDWEAFTWTAETGMVGMGDLPGGQFISAAEAISADGRVIVGGATSEQGGEAFRWTAETGMIGLGDLPGGPFGASATAVSADGSVVVGNGWESDAQRAFRWTEHTGMVALEKVHPSQIAQRAYGASWDGGVIVGELIVSGVGAGPFYWTSDGGTRWLTDVLAEHGVAVPDGWTLERANAVSADGRTIVGYGINPQGFTEGWVAYLGPACRADYDDDGVVDAEDVAAYLAAWLESNIFADWNYDGFINTRDLLAFFNEWVAQPGCE